MRNDYFADAFAKALNTIGNPGGSTFAATRKGNRGEILLLDDADLLLRLMLDGDTGDAMIVTTGRREAADAFVRSIEIMSRLHSDGWNGRFRVRTIRGQE